MPISIEEVRSLGDILTLNKWDLAFLNFPKAVSANLSSDDLNLRCYTASVPKRTNQKQEITIRGHKVLQPGDDDFGNQVTLVFFEDDAVKIRKFDELWAEAISALGTALKQKREEVKCDISLTRLNRQNEPVLRYIIRGCFREDAEEPELTGDPNAELDKYSIMISFDDFKREFLV